MILEKPTFGVDKRFFGYATEDKMEFTRLGNTYRHIVYTDLINIPIMTAIDGTQKLHSVAGSLDIREVGVGTGTRFEQHKLLVAEMPCKCLACGQVDTTAPCQFGHIRQVRELWVSEQKERPTALRSKKHVLLFDEIKEILKVDILTKAVLVEHLRLHNQAVWGNKDVLAKRLLAFKRTLAEIVPVPSVAPPQLPAPLAVDFITFESNELDYAGSDDDEN
jgi:hypothetical protein